MNSRVSLWQRILAALACLRGKAVVFNTRFVASETEQETKA